MGTINLLPSGYRPAKLIRLSVVLILVLFLLTSGYLANLIYITDIERSTLEANLHTVNSQIEGLNSLAALRERLYSIKSETEALKTDYQNGKMYESQILNMLSNVIPEQLQITSLYLADDGSVELIDCKATNYNILAEFMLNIKNVSIIENVEISSITKGKSNESTTVLNSFPERGEEYVTVGNITTTDMFSDNYTFSISFNLKDIQNNNSTDIGE